MIPERKVNQNHLSKIIADEASRSQASATSTSARGAQCAAFSFDNKEDGGYSYL